jgi:hypothetical protein
MLKRCEVDIEHCDPKHIKEILSNFAQSVHSKNFSYELKGTQATGKMNTSQGNTTRSLFYLRLVQQLAGIPDKFFKMEAGGDDTIMFMRRKDVELFVETAYKYVYIKDPDFDGAFGLGQVAKRFDVFLKGTGAEYLSTNIIINNAGEFMMMRKLERVFQLVSWTMNNDCANKKKRDDLNRQLARCEALNIRASCNDIRIMAALSDYLLRAAGEGKISFKDQIKHVDRTDSRKLEFNDAFEDYLFEKYDINCTDIEELITELQDNNLYGSCELEIIDKLMGVKRQQTWQVAYDKVIKYGGFEDFDISKKGILNEVRGQTDSGEYNTVYHTGL